jgi:hypothetical protein
MSKAIEVGTGGTVRGYSDEFPCTVIRTNLTLPFPEVTVQIDKSTRVDKNGMSETQEWTYVPDPKGVTYTFTQRKNGSWLLKGKRAGKYLTLGRRNRYHDYSF